MGGPGCSYGFGSRQRSRLISAKNWNGRREPGALQGGRGVALLERARAHHANRFFLLARGLLRPANRRAPPVFASILAISTAILTSLLAIGTSILTSISAILTPILAPHHPWRLGLGI
jgi:hypothetical protein